MPVITDCYASEEDQAEVDEEKDRLNAGEEVEGAISGDDSSAPTTDGLDIDRIYHTRTWRKPGAQS